MVVQVCVGSSCYLKGSAEIVKFLEEQVEKNSLKDKITLAGNFCLGKCNRTGVTVTVDGEIFVGITPSNIAQLWNDKIISKLD